MIDHADVIVGFKTYPHIDMYETGAHAARLLFAQLDGGTRPALAWVQLPLLSHTLRSATGEGAMQRAVERAQRMETEGLLAVTVFAGFALADIRDAGMSVVVTGRTRDEAQGAADELARQIWSERAGFVYRSLPLADSVTCASGLRADTGPVLLLDHGDNVMSGGTCDTTTVLDECLRQGMRGIGVGPLCDPQTVAQAIAAGVGARIDVALGNKLPLVPGIAVRPPLNASARVRAITDGRFKISGPIYTGEVWAMGRTVVLEAESFHGGGDRASDGAARPGRVRKRRRQSARVRFPDPQVADVLPPELRAAFVGSGRVRQRRRDELELRALPVSQGSAADLSARAPGVARAWG